MGRDPKEMGSLPLTSSAWSSEPQVPMSDPRARVKGAPWKTLGGSDSSRAQGRGLSPSGPCSIQYPEPLFSLLSLGKASHFHGTSISPAEPVQHGGYDSMFLGRRMPESKFQLPCPCFLIACSWAGEFTSLSHCLFVHLHNGDNNSTHLSGPCND